MGEQLEVGDLLYQNVEMEVCLINNRGHYIINPNKALLYGKSLQITLHLHCLIPPE